VRHLHLQHHDGDDDGDYPIGEGFKPPLMHCLFFSQWRRGAGTRQKVISVSIKYMCRALHMYARPRVNRTKTFHVKHFCPIEGSDRTEMMAEVSVLNIQKALWRGADHEFLHERADIAARLRAARAQFMSIWAWLNIEARRHLRDWSRTHSPKAFRSP